MLIIIFVLYCFFLLTLSALKSAGLFLPLLLQFQAMLGGDKLMHLQLATILSLLACLAFQIFFVRKAIDLIWQLLVIFVVLSTALLLDELHQYLLSSRHFELMDTVFGILGIAIGLVVYCAVVVIKNYRAKVFRI
ncbi:MAG: VanZ family protein [Oleispira sp.]|nr:VanZ family protein [Oleispira sp.]